MVQQWGSKYKEHLVCWREGMDDWELVAECGSLLEALEEFMLAHGVADDDADEAPH